MIWNIEILEYERNTICSLYLRFKLFFAVDRNEIQSKFSNAILEMQQKSGLKYMVLEKKIAAMREELDIKDAHLHQLSHSDKSGQGEKAVQYNEYGNQSGLQGAYVSSRIWIASPIWSTF